jgi:O-succinylbenzoic acid--CoA ligase
VILSYGNHYYNALGSNQNIPLGREDCWLLVLPLYHVGGLSILYRSLLAGTSVWVCEGFDESEVNHLIDHGQITHLSLVPSMLQRLIESRAGRPVPSTLRAILLGGAPVPGHLCEQILALDMPVLTTYGLTEAASQVTALSFDDHRELTRSSGRVLPYRRLKIVDSMGKELPVESTGEITIGGEVLFYGYLGEFSEDAVKNRWFRTGDLGHLSPQGYLTVQGRLDEMMTSGGEKIYPLEIVRVAESFHGVRSAVVVPFENREWGESPALFVEASDPDRFPVESLKALLREKLAAFKVPPFIRVVSEMPRTAIGKIDKMKLREQCRRMF